MTTPSVAHTPLDSVDRAIAAIERAAAESSRNVRRLTRNDYEVLFADIEARTEEFLQTAIRNVAEPCHLTERIRKRRSYLALSTGITSEVVGICKQVLAFGAAGLGLSLGFADKIRLLTPSLQKAITIAGIVYLELVLVSLLVLIWYLLQARFRYPFLSFRRIGNTWFAFYYASVSAEVPRWPIQLPTQRYLAGKLYAEDLVRFTERVVTETETDELRFEIQQYFLLLSYQSYVNQFSLRLTNLFTYGFVGAVLSGVALTIVAYLR